MALKIPVSLASGRCTVLESSPECRLADLRAIAGRDLGVCIARFACGASLLPWSTPVEAVTGGLTAIAQQLNVAASARSFTVCEGLRVQATCGAFAGIRADGTVVTWGDEASGGDSRAVKHRLKGVVELQASSKAFAAVLADGGAVTWGHPDYGGDSSTVQVLLRGVKRIQSTGNAFAAILANGNVVTWGDKYMGGDSSKVQGSLRDVKDIQASGSAFAAILGDGSVVTWGRRNAGGDSCKVSHLLKGVQQIQASHMAFAAVLADHSVVGWGHPWWGGEVFRGVRAEQLQATWSAFAALQAGYVTTWGDPDLGGDSRAVSAQLRDVRAIQASRGAFCALLGDQSVVTWGSVEHGGQGAASQVSQVQATQKAFAALRLDGSVVAWGDPGYGGDCSGVRDQLRQVVHIAASSRAFAAVRGDGSLVMWGDHETMKRRRTVAEETWK